MKIPIFKDKIGQSFEENDVVAYTSGTCGLKMQIGTVIGTTNRRIKVELNDGSIIRSDPDNLIVISQQIAFFKNEVPMDGLDHLKGNWDNKVGQPAKAWFLRRGIDVYKEIENLE